MKLIKDIIVIGGGLMAVAFLMHSVITYYVDQVDMTKVFKEEAKAAGKRNF